MVEEYQQSIIATQLEKEELRSAFQHWHSSNLDLIVHETKADQGISFLRRNIAYDCQKHRIHRKIIKTYI